jgi:hypothetical protein
VASTITRLHVNTLNGVYSAHADFAGLFQRVRFNTLLRHDVCHDRIREQIQLLAQRDKLRHTLRIAFPLSLGKFAIVLKSGAKRCVNHISSTLRCASRSSRRLDWMRLR